MGKRERREEDRYGDGGQCETVDKAAVLYVYVYGTTRKEKGREKNGVTRMTITIVFLSLD